MSKVNLCLKRGFIIMTCVVGLISGLTMGLTLFVHGHFHSSEGIDGMIVAYKVLYAVDTVTLLLVAIGIYGAAKEKSWLLIIFSTGMSLIILLLAFNLVSIIIFRKELLDGMAHHFHGEWPKPLDTANSTELKYLYDIQEHMRCCGVDIGYQDWGSHIHASCICSEDVTDCIPAPKNSTLQDGGGEIVMVFKQPCLPMVMANVTNLMSVMVSIVTALVIFWSVSLLLSIVINVQLRRKVDVPPVYYSAEAKSGNYASLAANANVE